MTGLQGDWKISSRARLLERGAWLSHCARSELRGLGFALLVLMSTALGCAQWGGERVESAQHAYLLAEPSRERVAWEAVSMPDAELAFRGPNHEVMTFFTNCKLETQSPRVLARQLTTGIALRAWRQRDPVEVAGQSGWLQEIEIDASGEVLTMKTVTVVANKCSYDWVLVAGSTYAAAVASFDGWWSSFRFVALPTEGAP